MYYNFLSGVKAYISLEFFLSGSNFEKGAEDNSTQEFLTLTNKIHPTVSLISKCNSTSSTLSVCHAILMSSADKVLRHVYF